MYDSLQQEFQKKNMDVQMANAKALYNHNIALEFEEKKYLMREFFLEKQKSQYEEVIIQDNGELEVVTRNLLADAKARRLCNFSNPEMIKLFNEKNDYVVLNLILNMGAKKVRLYFAASEVGNSKYLLKKFSEAGCEIYARNRKIREEYLYKIFMCLLNRCTESQIIPDKYGWNKHLDGTFEFVEPTSLIWKEVWSWTK